MLWIIPGMLLAMVGDYCMGIEPKDCVAISGMISSGWLSIADWRIAVSNIGGLVWAVLMRLIGDYGLTNALATGWISIGNLWMMSGLLVMSGKVRAES